MNTLEGGMNGEQLKTMMQNTLADHISQWALDVMEAAGVPPDGEPAAMKTLLAYAGNRCREIAKRIDAKASGPLMPPL